MFLETELLLFAGKRANEVLRKQCLGSHQGDHTTVHWIRTSTLAPHEEMN